MADFSEQLGLDPDLVRRVADARRGFAHAYSDDRSEASGSQDWRTWAASEYASAGALTALFDRESSLEDFARAAELFRDAGDSGWLTLLACAETGPFERGGESVQREAQGLMEVAVESEDDFWWLLLRGAELIDARGDTRGRVPAPRHRSSTLTRFGISSTDLQSSLLSLARDAEAEVRANRPSPTLHCLEHMNITLERARADRFHWPRLQSAVLPVEPEFLAYCVLLSHALHAVRAGQIESFIGTVRETLPLIAVTLEVALSYRGELQYRV